MGDGQPNKTSSSVGGQRVLTFRLPSPPPSMNSLYSIHYAMRRIFMRPEVRTYKTTMKMYVPGFEVGDNDMVELEITVHRDWMCKNGKIKKVDIQNMQKVLVDLVCEKQGFDDKHVWRCVIEKVQDDKRNFVEIKERKIEVA